MSHPRHFEKLGIFLLQEQKAPPPDHILARPPKPPRGPGGRTPAPLRLPIAIPLAYNLGFPRCQIRASRPSAPNRQRRASELHSTTRQAERNPLAFRSIDRDNCRKLQLGLHCLAPKSPPRAITFDLARHKIPNKIRPEPNLKRRSLSISTLPEAHPKHGAKIALPLAPPASIRADKAPPLLLRAPTRDLRSFLFLLYTIVPPQLPYIFSVKAVHKGVKCTFVPC